MTRASDGEPESGTHRQMAPPESRKPNMSGLDQEHDNTRAATHRTRGMSSTTAKYTKREDGQLPTGQSIVRPSASSSRGDKHARSSSRMDMSYSETSGQARERSGMDSAPRSTSCYYEDYSEFRQSKRPEAGMNEQGFAHGETSPEHLSRKKLSKTCGNEVAMASEQSHPCETSSANHLSSATENHSRQSVWAFRPITNAVRNFISSASTPSSSKTTSLQDSDPRISDASFLSEKLREKARAYEKLVQHYNALAIEYKNLQHVVHGMQNGEENLQHQIRELQHIQEKSERKSEAEIRRLTSERDSAVELHEETIRKQQEASFRQMSTGRWIPTQDSDVVAGLDRIKSQMRTWARTNATKSLDSLCKLDSSQVKELLESLSQVAVLDNQDVPAGLTGSKAPTLLLNALLAHDLYSKVFRNPFLSLETADWTDLQQTGGVDLLHKIYRMSQQANVEEAHSWRSQTLRLLLPPLTANASEGERQMRSTTEQAVEDVSKSRASQFLEGAAKYLFDSETNKDDVRAKLKDIYHGAAKLSFNLWTQRTALKCVTLKEMGPRFFDADSEYLKPHSLVRYEDHEDQLKGKPITIIVHPLLLASGTDEGKDYDCNRIWASAEVWLDSK